MQLGKFGANPEIKTAAEAEQALQVLRTLWIESARVESRLEERLAEVRAEYAEQATLRVGRQRVGIDEYYDRLQQALLAYVAEHDADLFPEGVQQQQLPSGCLGWQQTQPKIAATEGRSDDDVVELVVGLLDLTRQLGRIRERLAPWLSLTCRVDRAAIRAARTAGTIDDDDLERFGLEHLQEAEFYVEINERAAGEAPAAA